MIVILFPHFPLGGYCYMKESFLKDRFYDVAVIGAKGQIVIPAKARKDFDLKPGDKLMAIRGMGDMGIVLINVKQLSNIFDKVAKHIGEMRSVITKGKGNQ